MGESLNNNFVHFKIHSQFSICEGAIKIDNLKDHCKINKFKSLGICDTSNLSGALEFSETISKQGTQPIIGTQIIFNYKNERGHLTLIPKNESGYKKVIKLSSMSYLENDNTSEPHCNINELFRENSDFILMSGTINGLIGKLFVKGYHSEIEEIYKKLSNNFKNNFYIEIQRHNDLNEKSFEKFNLNLSYKLDILL